MGCHDLLRGIFPNLWLECLKSFLFPINFLFSSSTVLSWFFALNNLKDTWPNKSEIVSCSACPTLCNLMDYSLPGFSVHGIFQARVLEWVAISFSRWSSRPRNQTQVSCTARRCFTLWATREALLVAQFCPTLWDPTGCSPPGSSVHWTLQARILEWVAIPFSRESSWPRDWTWVSCISGRFFTIWDTREAPSDPMPLLKVTNLEGENLLCRKVLLA